MRELGHNDPDRCRKPGYDTDVHQPTIDFSADLRLEAICEEAERLMEDPNIVYEILTDGIACDGGTKVLASMIAAYCDAPGAELGQMILGALVSQLTDRAAILAASEIDNRREV